MANPICPQFGCGNYEKVTNSEGTRHFCVQYVVSHHFFKFGNRLFSKKQHEELELCKKGNVMKCARCMQSEERIKG